MSGKQEFTRKQTLVLSSLLEGATVAQVAKTACVTERTIYRWLKEPAFQAELKAREQAVLERTTRRLLALTEKALDSLEELLEDYGTRGASVRLRAVQVSLEQLVRFRDMFDIEERLARLERQVNK